ncbi:DUF881 domain-containing protein [Nocardioides ferulae]|uniref:DUF881 domain-containing protein n=1 Tax=Nocardioides ferulae TaxID=2340821 RepID=UPI000EADC6D6|nr:DUF881 domain-containing protein [Nocardioides ferulae]
MPEQPERRPVEPPGTTGRDRMVRALLRPSRSQVVVAVLLALLGFAAVTQARSTDVNNSYAGFREQDLIDVLEGLAGARQRAQAEIVRLDETRDELLSDTDAHRAALSQAQSEAEALAILAGTVPVTGPGIRVTITETVTPVDLLTVLDMVQELRSAGAEAIQFNGQVRVVADTGFEDGPGGLFVGGELLSPPYVVDVIGDPHRLEGGIMFPDGAVRGFEEDGATVTVQPLESLDIESVVEAEAPEFAEPDIS